MSEEKEKDSNEESRDPVEPEVLERDEPGDEDNEEVEPEGEVAEEEEEEEEEEEVADGDQDGMDLEDRVLCVDGACIGVVGQDGKCKVCGTPHPDGPPAAASPAPVPTEKAEPSQEGEAAAREEQEDQSQGTAEDVGTGTDDPLDFSKRVLCSDGSCIGVIGKDGKCRACGKPYTGEPEDED